MTERRVKRLRRLRCDRQEALVVETSPPEKNSLGAAATEGTSEKQPQLAARRPISKSGKDQYALREDESTK